jgi:hypothetical protein
MAQKNLELVGTQIRQNIHSENPRNPSPSLAQIFGEAPTHPLLKKNYFWLRNKGSFVPIH